MSIVAILEVAIGMIFAWLVLSLAGMYIQEWVVSKLQWRSDMLETYIGNLMTDANLARQLYDHPLIKALHSGLTGDKRPSYIPASQFSLALLDIIRNSPKEAALIQKTLYRLQSDIDLLNKDRRALANQQLNLAITLTRKAIASDGKQEITGALLDEVKKVIRKLSSDFPELQPMIENKFLDFAAEKQQIDIILAELQTNDQETADESNLTQIRVGLAVMSVTYPDLKRAVEALINEIGDLGENVESALFRARKNMEEWFNNGMDRLSGWYKRRAQNMALILGLTLAALLNVDSLQLATQLWRDPSIRQALAAQADALVSQNPQGMNPDAGVLVAINTQINQLNIPIGWVSTSMPTDTSGAIYIGDGTQKLCTLQPDSSLDLYGIHFGNQCYPIINTPHLDDLTGWLLKIFGLAISGIAAAQGAPFWFDILKNVVNVRSAGINSDARGAK